jgi:hypothetical protein
MERRSLYHAARYLQLVCCLFIALLFGTSCGQPAPTGPTTTQAGGASPQGCDIEVSWAMFYETLGELKRATALDLAVQGVFTTILSTQGQENPSSGSNGPISTNFSFTISKVLLDPHHLLTSSPTHITIHQTGGWQGNTLHQVCGDPLFRISEGTILFLHQFSPGQYLVIGCPSGRFEVHHGFVQPVNDEGVKLPPNLTEQQFDALLQKA